ncbi:MAG: flavin reductase [Alphaproteobacteria bacterium]|nr:flavin reductase [Alphaproteobacteria bacterium]
MADEHMADAAQPAIGHAAIDADDFRQVMRRVATPVAVVTSVCGDDRVGMTSTSVCFAAVDPPALLVPVKRSARAAAAIEDSRILAVNFLSEVQHGIARAFLAEGASTAVVFCEGSWSKGATGAPLLRHSVASFDCVVEDVLATGTHLIFVSRVIATSSDDAGALLYRDGFFRRLDENF